MKTAALIAVTAFVLIGCSGNNAGSYNPLTGERDSRIDRLSVEELYDRARQAMDAGDGFGALEFYNRIEARFPFTDYARQALLESTAAYYRARDESSAIASADRFIAQYPRHPNIDYAHYMKALSFARMANNDSAAFFIDGTKRDPSSARNAFFSFAQMVGQFPDSQYVADARQHMIWLRERLASHELHAAQFYLSRRGWVAAARRANEILETYPETQAISGALEVMITAYRELNLDDLARDAERVYRLNYDASGKSLSAPSDKAPELPELS